MRRAVLAVAHRVVREDEDRRQLHQRGEPDRGPRVVAEDEEGRAERPQLRQRQPVHDRAHRVLADAEVQVPAARAGGLEISGAGERQRRLVRRAEVGRATEEPRDVLREDVQHLARGLPSRHTLRIGREHGEVRDPSPPAARAAASDRSPSPAPGTGIGTRRRAPSTSRRASAPRFPMPAAKCSRTPSGTRNVASSGQP